MLPKQLVFGTFHPWWPASWWQPSMAFLLYALGTTNSLVLVVSLGGEALTYNLLFMITRCFRLLIRANPSFEEARSPSLDLRDKAWSVFIHLIVTYNSGSSLCACPNQQHGFHLLGLCYCLVLQYLHMLSSASACCIRGLCSSALLEASMATPSNKHLMTSSSSPSFILLRT